MRLVYLSSVFYAKYGNTPELMAKHHRPYVCFIVRRGNQRFALPLRHHFSHPYGFHTAGDGGLDFSKAVLIDDDSMLSQEPARIDSSEWYAIKSAEEQIISDFLLYLHRYKRALEHPDNPRSSGILRYSTLRFFNVDYSGL